MKSDILFIHGAGDGAYEWTLPRITPIHELYDHYRFHFPRMPKPDAPSYQKWSKQLKEELMHIDDQAILVGHSLGGSVLLKYFSENDESIPDDKYKALFLVSTPFWGENGWDGNEFELRSDFAKHLGMFSNIYILHNEDDDVVPFSHHKIYLDKIPGAVAISFKSGEHLATENLASIVDVVRDLEKKQVGV
ncbi:MAG: alpha/beta fold hydrolase [Flavitalea sp.]